MNEGRKAAWQMAGGWLLLGWGSVQKHEWRLQAGGSAEGAQTRLVAWRTAVSVHVKSRNISLGPLHCLQVRCLCGSTNS